MVYNSFVMRKRESNFLFICLSVLIFFLFSVVIVSPSLALSLTRAQQDYLYNLEKYQDSYSKFIGAKGAYMKYRTLSTRDEVIAVGREFLGQRAELVRTYLVMLRSKISQTPPDNFFQQEKLLKEINSQILFFSQYKERAKLIQTIEEFNQLSEEFDEQFLLVRKIYQQTVGLLLLKKEFLLLGEIDKLRSLAFSNFKFDAESSEQSIWRESIIQKIEDSRSSFNSTKNSLIGLEDRSLSEYQFNQRWREIKYYLMDFKKDFNRALFFLEELVSRI